MLDLDIRIVVAVVGVKRTLTRVCDVVFFEIVIQVLSMKGESIEIH